jgi:hypothetical protein
MRTRIQFSFIIMFLAVIVMPTQATEEELLLYFDFEQVNGQTVKEKTGSGHDGTLAGGAKITTQIAKRGSALQIEDPTAVMTVETFAELEEYQDNSYLFWLYFTAGSNGAWSQIIAKKAPGNDRAPGIWINPGGTGIHYRFNPGNQGAGRIGPGGENQDFETGQWFHVAGIKETGELRIYINGEEAGKYNVPENHAQGTEKLYVGQTGYRSATFVIDELAVYNRAVTPDEVNEIMDVGVVAVEPQGKLATTWGNLKRQY